jgi:ATP-dependent RNA helicase RhlE
MLKVDIEMVEVEGYTPTKTIRLGNESPGTGRPAGNRPPQRNQRRPHVNNAPRHAHAGPKKHGGDAPRRSESRGAR